MVEVYEVKAEYCQQVSQRDLPHVDIYEARYQLFVDGNETRLTWVQWKYLLAFIHRPMHILSRNRLLDIVYADDEEGGALEVNTVSKYIEHLRRKLAPADVIVTRHGFGYQFVPARATVHLIRED